MNNNNLLTPKELFRTATKGLKNIDKKPLTRANVRYMFASIALTGLIMWLFGINVWTSLLGLFLQSIYFFGQKVTTFMFRFSLAGVVLILVSGFVYNVFIEKTGLSDDYQAYNKDKILKKSVELNNQAVDLQARYKGLAQAEADRLLKENFNNPEGLLKAIDSIKHRRDLLYNSLYYKKVQAHVPANHPSNQALQQSQSKQLLNVEQFKRQQGDTAYYTFTLKANEVSSGINLVDQNGKFYAYSLTYSNDLVVVGPNGYKQVWNKGRHYDFWEPNFYFEGIPGNAPVTISLKVFPAANA